MKTKCSFILKASTALVLALLMLFGTVATSMAAVVDDLATTGNSTIYLLLSGTHSTVKINIHKGTGGSDPWFTDSMTDTGKTKNGNKIYSASVNDEWGGLGKFEFNVDGTYHDVFGNGDVWHNDPSIWRGRMYDWDSSTWMDYAEDPVLTKLGTPSLKYNNATTTPVDITASSASLTWANVANASSYELFKDGVSLGTKTSGCSVSETGSYTVKAIGDGTSYSNSDASNAIQLNFIKTTRIYVKKDLKNKSNKAVVGNAHIWSNSSDKWTGNWPGEEISSNWTEAGDYYYKEYSNSYTKFKVIFNKDSNQTDNSEEYATGKIWVFDSVDSSGGNGKAEGTESYIVNIGTVTNGTVTTDKPAAESGATVTLTATPSSGYVNTKPTVTKASGGTVTVSGSGPSYTFEMPAENVTVTDTFAADTTPTITSFTIGGSSSKTLNIGETAALASTTSNAGGATVTYSSSNTSVATVSGSTVTAVGSGSATITAKLTGAADKTVTVTVNTPTISVDGKTGLKIGDTWSPSATLTNPDTADSGWTVVYTKQSGTATTLSGSTITGVKYDATGDTYKASYQYNGVEKASTTFTVKTAEPTVSITSANTANVGADVSLTATSSGATTTPTYTWSVTNGSGTASVSGTTLTAKTPGTVTVKVTAAYNANYSKEVTQTFTVKTPAVSLSGNAKVAVGDTITLTPSVTNVTGTPTYTYTSSDSTKATVNNSGVVSGVAAGTVTITVTATLGDWSGTATKTITVEAPDLKVKDGDTSVADGNVYTTIGKNTTLDVSANFSDSLTAKSSNSSVATVSYNSSTGKLTITPVGKGICKVSVSTNSGFVPTGAIFPGESVFNSKFNLAAVGAVAPQTVQFTVNVAEADTYKYLYFTDGVGWSGVKAYLYGDGNNASFPGEAMVKIGKNEQNKDVYAIRYPATKNYTNVIISNANNSENRVKMSGNSNLNMPSGNDNAIWADSIDNNGNAGYWGCSLTKPQITAPNVTIDMGSTQTMTATVLTSGTPDTFNWSSGTTSVATTADTHTISNTITGVAPGTSTITIKAYAAKPNAGWTYETTEAAEAYIAGTTTATATVVAEDKTVTFGEKKTDDGTIFTDGSGHITAKYYDEDTSSGGDSGSGSGGDSGSEPESEPSGGPYYLHIGKQSAFRTNTAIQFTWSGSYYYASYNVETNSEYPFVINTKNTALGDSDKPSSAQSVTTYASTWNPDSIGINSHSVNNNNYDGFYCFKFQPSSAGTIYITFTPSGGVAFRASISSGSGSSGSGSSGSGGGESGSGTGYTGEGTTMTSPQSVPYGKVAVFTAEATYTSGNDTYAFAEWVDGSGNKITSDNPYIIKVTADQTVYARYYKVFKLSAFDSYEKVGSSVNFVTAPPKVITVKHGADTYTYNFEGTAPGGHPGTPDDPQATYPDPLPINSGGTYGQGNYIQYLAGDEITLIYSAMASSETFKGVFYNNSVEYYLAKPSASQFEEHDYAAAHTLYMNSAYYEAGQVPSGLPTTTVDPDAHSIKFTGTQDYKNIDVEVGTKRKVYFSDYTNAVIGSKNVDDYYSDREDLSVTGDQLTVKAAKSATQTNTIVGANVGFYHATAQGGKGAAVSVEDISTYELSAVGTSNSTASADGDPVVISGKMPPYDLYIDLNMTNSYTIKLGSKVISDSLASKTKLAEVADVKIKQGSDDLLIAPNNADVTATSADIPTGTQLSLTTAYTGSWGDYYTFVGWYWGDDTAPDYAKGFISDKLTLNYTPKKGGTIWAVGTRSLYINGSRYITGKDTDWYGENNVQKNLEMSFDAESGRYYWEITDTMFAAAGSNYKTWSVTDWDEKHTDYGVYAHSDAYYWTDNDDKYHGKSFFQILDSESGSADKTVWDSITSFTEDTPANGPTYGKIYPRDYSDDYYKRHDGQGFINFNETDYAGQSSPLRIYYNPSATGNARLTVESTKIYSNLYVSNGYTVGSTLKTSAVTVEPVVDGVVKTSGQTGYFSVGQQGTGWDPDVEGHVTHYKPQKKGATVRITKTAGGSDKIEAFFIYDITNKTVRAERDVKNSGSNYYIDLTLANEEQNLYIVPIIEEAGANVTISFDATQLNRAQWGDIVTAYAWYQNNGGAALGDYPGQPMIPSDDMTTWTTTFVGKKGNNELEGITFSNYVDGAHSWLGCSGVMGTVSDHKTGTASGGIVNVYNHVYSGNTGEYARTNFKAQTYDYREPIALYERFKGQDHVTISFSMKDGNSSLISWRHTDLTSHNIVTLEPDPDWGKLNWEYLTNAKGDKYIDMNGNTMKTKPTASFYVAAKGLVLYGNSSMTNVFYSGKSYDPVSGVTYGAASGIGMNYAVQWYVYDASGNYITNVLTAGIADVSAEGAATTYIGKRLEDMGYAVDGKSVAICYDKPRYMYGDAESGSGATGYNGKVINVGANFDAYRFTGQWNAVASNELVTVNVGVGMMTDSGEVLSTTNHDVYGNATASYDTQKGNNTRVTDDDGNEAPFTAPNGSFVRTAVRDASNSPVKLTADAQNFIGWYYYDANTGDFVKANYASNVNFYPNYSNKDVTFYAMYRASAVYNYIYQGREGQRTYSAAGEDLLPAEMDNNTVIYANHRSDVISKLPVGIGVFKRDINFSVSGESNWSFDNSTPYLLKLSGFAVGNPVYYLTAHYLDAEGNLVTVQDSEVYNGKAVNLTTGEYTDSENHEKPAGTPVTSYHSGFIGWYEYNNETHEVGELLSTQANYGMRLTKNQHIIAKYDGSLPSDGWNAFIDENEVNKELTTEDTGVFYNDTIVRIRNGSDVKAELPEGSKIGVIVVCDNKTNNPISNYTDTQLNQLVGAIAPGNTMGTKKGLSITNMQANGQTSFNRTDIAVRADYAKTLGAKYCVYAYIYDGQSQRYYFSDASAVKTYE